MHAGNGARAGACRVPGAGHDTRNGPVGPATRASDWSRLASGPGRVPRRLVHVGLQRVRIRVGRLGCDRLPDPRLARDQPRSARDRVRQPRLDGSAPLDPDRGSRRGATQVLIVATGHNDRRYEAAAVAAAAKRDLDRLRAALPHALIVVIAPIWPDGQPPASLLGLRDALRVDAASIHAILLDPLRGGWFAGPFHALISGDGIHPTNTGERHIAQRVLASLVRTMHPRTAMTITRTASQMSTPTRSAMPSPGACAAR